MPVKRWQNFDLKNLSNKSEFQSELEIPRNSMGHKMTLFRRINNVIIYSHKEKDIDSGLKQFIYVTLESCLYLESRAIMPADTQSMTNAVY